MMTDKKSFKKFHADLKKVIPKNQIYTDELRRYAYAHDASPYLLIPKIIVKVESENEIQACLKAANRYQIPLTFRAAGTSLSGQSSSDRALVMLGENWRGYKILAKGEIIYLEPGVIGAEANLYLAPYRRKIGPDPASINSCKIGGIAANNASGMCCGIADNSYHTMEGLRLILPDGTILDTHASHSIAQFRLSHADLLGQLLRLREKMLENTALTDLIRHQYQIKNTVGYSLNALLDYTDPIEILTHLMIGSEGTLGFIAGISYRTLPALPHEAAALLHFESIEAACAAALLLPVQLISALELMDGESGPVLLVDLKAPTSTHLKAKIALINLTISKRLTLTTPHRFVTERTAYQALWNIRKGILPILAAKRKPGWALINEDVAVPVEALPTFCKALQHLFATHHYDKASIFGHAKDGNLHFLLEADFHSEAGTLQYRRFMDDLTTLVIEHHGALKAEHGTGRNMAPFVEKAWGPAAYEIMEEIKALLDPTGILNPDVILSKNPSLHIENLKTFPAVHSLIDACIECGFCERVCPSKNLSLTPRGRIAALRDRARTQKHFPTFKYQGIDSCAKTGLCALHCPVGINTGDLMLAMQAELRTSWQKALARFLAQHFSWVTLCVRTVWRFWV